MKSLTVLLKNSISTLLLLFILCATSYGQLRNFTQVRQDEGLIMRRLHSVAEGETPTLGTSIMNFHSDTPPGGVDRFDYMYMRATSDDKSNNVIITNDGTVMISGNDNCASLRDMKADAVAASSDIKLYVNGEIATTTGNGTVTILSDQRFKKNIVPLQNSLDVIRQSNFVEFQYNDLSGVTSNKKYYGILAQEMQKVLPSTIKKGSKRIRPDDKKGTEFLMFNPNDLIYSGLNAIKELDKENQALKDKVTELETKLGQRINELEKILTQLTKGKELDKQNANTRTITDTASSYLYQNQPNPIYNTTNIEYHLASNTSSAQIIIQDLNGNQITKFNLKGEGTGSVTFNAKQFDISSGTYVYSLVINDTVIASKKMIFIE